MTNEERLLEEYLANGIIVEGTTSNAAVIGLTHTRTMYRGLNDLGDWIALGASRDEVIRTLQHSPTPGEW